MYLRPLIYSIPILKLVLNLLMTVLGTVLQTKTYLGCVNTKQPCNQICQHFKSLIRKL